MLYYLFEFFEKQYNLTGASLFQYITFRASVAVILSTSFSMLFGKKFIEFLKKKQIGEPIRDLGLIGQIEKQGTPSMGGLIIIFGTLLPVLLLAKLDNIYILLLISTILWIGFIGWLDDYIKIIKKNKKGLKGEFKIFGQILLGAFVGTILFFHPQVTVRTQSKSNIYQIENKSTKIISKNIKASLTTIPLFKNNQFDYYSLIKWSGLNEKIYLANLYSNCNFYNYCSF